MLGAQLTGITDDGRKNATSAATAGAAEQRLLPPSASTKVCEERRRLGERRSRRMEIPLSPSLLPPPAPSADVHTHF